jgi:hypothetical protein
VAARVSQQDADARAGALIEARQWSGAAALLEAELPDEPVEADLVPAGLDADPRPLPCRGSPVLERLPAGDRLIDR